MNRPPTAADPPLAPVADWFQGGFHRFLRPFLRRNFDAIAVARANRPQPGDFDDGPLVVFSNHPSWWDPVVAHFLNHELFPSRQFRAPIDADALSQYQVFERLGFFGVQNGTRAGAATFLKTAAAVLDSPHDALWITPEGRFADARDPDATLMPGLAHVCHKIGREKNVRGRAVALALEYVFWNEKLPMCLARFSSPIDLADPMLADKSALLDRFTTVLRTTQSELADDAIKRRGEPFENLLVGKSGGGLFYDTFRRFKSVLTGQRFSARHQKIQP